MLTAEERTILDDYKKAFQQYRRNKNIVDLDAKLVKRLNFFLVRVEDTLPHLQFSIPPHRQSQFIIAFFTRGKGEITIGNVKVQVTDRTLIFIPGQTINSAKHSSDTRGYFLIANLNFFLSETFPSQHLKHLNLFRSELMPYVYTGARQGKNLDKIFEAILDEKHHERLNKNEMITLKILELLIVCERFFKKGEKTATSLLPLPVIEYINLIQRFYKEQHAVSFYADKLHLHPNRLNALSKRHLLQPAKATIDLKLITEAKSLLANTTLSVKEVAYELGFQSSSHFFRFFKRHTGNSPVQYRQLHLNL
ncbi:MAG: AraC family transcriptional regulator [Sphingobacteriales bacterium]|nr:MAG: AraC family transcriptional regulator [Sphingobacteriales bacterium]